MSKTGNTNILLVKADLGKVKPGFHQLPPQNHVYGHEPQKDKYGARQVISNWQSHKPSGVKELQKDFRALNKNGILNGCTNAKDINKYRQSNDARIKVKQGQKYYDIKLPPQDFVFGIPNRPSTPIKNVICNTYAAQNQEQIKEKEAVLKLLNEKQPEVPVVQKRDIKIPVNRKDVIEKNNFKLQKFKNVNSKIKPLMNK